MKCPFCSCSESKVIDSRPSDDGQSIRRRRECMYCKNRFTTYETVEKIPLLVVKKDGTSQSFDKSKLLSGLVRACEKRPISLQTLSNAADDIEQSLMNSLKREITSLEIGEYAMQKLKEIDEIAYIRFASVYRQFGDLGAFANELNKLMDKGN